MQDPTPEQALAQLNKNARESKKFAAFFVTSILMSLLTALAIWKGAPKDVTNTIVMTYGLVALGYLGSTAWQDRAVRAAAVMRGQTPPVQL